MPTVALKAHYDGRQIVLDEPFEIPPHSSLLITLLPANDESESEEKWLSAISRNDAFAFLTNPAEDIYTLQDGEPFRDGV